MSGQQHQRERLIEKRARALAMMLLTRREDLLIEEVKDDIGLDYLVRFNTKGKKGLRVGHSTARSRVGFNQKSGRHLSEYVPAAKEALRSLLATRLPVPVHDGG